LGTEGRPTSILTYVSSAAVQAAKVTRDTVSALPPKVDMCSATQHVRFVPKADICTAIPHFGNGRSWLTINPTDGCPHYF
jgi:hypothetical protein